MIGIGPGDPEQVTVQAIRAINRADAIFVVDKGERARELVGLRHEILRRYLEPVRSPRIVALADPPRDRAAPAYGAAVTAWRRARANVWERAIADELGPDGCGAFLVWGDPSLYDSTLAVLDDVLARGAVSFDHEVIPGIASPQALAARHRVALNRVGGAVRITTGRRLAAGLPPGDEDLVVMLDGEGAFASLDGVGLDIYWGAYVGTAEEILLAGPLGELAGEIRRRRDAARERRGWIMDTYLLRRSRAGE